MKSQPSKIWLRSLLKGVALAATAFTQWLPGATLASITALTAALWLWAGTDGSLRQAMAVVAPLVPHVESLEWTGLQATLRDGGRAEQLVWQQNGLTVRVTQPRFSWHFLPLLLGQPMAVELGTGAVHVTDQRPANPEPFPPPEDIDLPVAVTLDFDLGPLLWANGPTQSPLSLVHSLRGRYTWAENANGDDEHHIRLVEMRAAQGRYQGDVRVLSAAPLTLSAHINGTVSSPPDATTPGWQAATQVRITGDLHGPQATLAVAAQVDSPSHGPKADLQAQLQPWQRQPLRQLQAQLHRLDLAAFWSGLPHTLLTGNAQAEPASGQAPRWTVSADLTNGLPGAWDNGRLPVASLAVQAHGNGAAGQLTRLNARAAGGTLSGGGNWQGAVWQGQLQAHGLQLAELDTRLPPAVLQGTLHAKQRTTNGKHPSTHTDATLEATATAPSSGKILNSKQIISIKRQASISSRVSWDGTHLGMHPLKLALDSATLQAQGALTPRTQAWDGVVQLQAPGLQASSQGHLAPDAGKGQLVLDMDDGTALARWLGSLPMVGAALGQRGGQWAPAGQGQAHITWDGGWRVPALQLDVRALVRKLAMPAPPGSTPWGANELALSLVGTPAQWQASARGQLYRAEIGAQLNLSLTGHTPGMTLGTKSEKGANPLGAPGQLTVSQMAVDLGPREGPAAVRATAPQPLTLNWRAGHTQLSAGALNLHVLGTHPPAPPAWLGWDASTWGTGGLFTAGRFSGLGVQSGAQALASLGAHAAQQALQFAGLSGDLSLQGQWQFTLPEGTRVQQPQGLLLVTRQRGDLTLDQASPAYYPNAQATPSNPALPLGLTQASVELAFLGEDLHLKTQWDSARAGQVNALLTTRLAPAQTTTWGWLPQRGAPLGGKVQATLPDVGVWARLAPPGWRVRGQLGLNATVSGTLGQPDWRGELNGNALELQSAVDGLVFGHGTLRATLGEHGVNITHFKLEGEGGEASGGSLQLTGRAHWPNTGPTEGNTPSEPSLSLQASAQRLRVSARADRRLTLSGQAHVQLDQGRLSLKGKLRADQAQFTLPDETTPSLGQDVVVRLTKAAPTAPHTAPVRTDVALQIDLGTQFELKGQGLQTRLSGELTLTTPPRSDGFDVVGEVRAVNGTYRAYGQPLHIENGVLRFSGPFDDPALEVLALRDKGAPMGNGTDSQQVGVQITGSARTPRVALYATPDLPDSEKLAWLVLGRPASGVGTETAVLQQAAVALLSRQNGGGMNTSLASALGLDDISLRGNTTQRSDGSVAQATAVTLGKRLSSKLYVAYQQGLNNALSAVNVFYDVSRNLTVRAQAGQESALDLIFTLRHD